MRRWYTGSQGDSLHRIFALDLFANGEHEWAAFLLQTRCPCAAVRPTKHRTGCTNWRAFSAIPDWRVTMEQECNWQHQHFPLPFTFASCTPHMEQIVFVVCTPPCGCGT